MELPDTLRSAQGQISVGRDGHWVTLSFPTRDFGLVSIVRSLPYASEDRPGHWRAALCYESVAVLAGLHRQGTVETDVDSLLGPASDYRSCRDGLVVPYRSERYPYSLWQAWQEPDPLLQQIPGGFERRGTRGLVYPHTSGGAIASLVFDGVLSDAQGIFPQADAVICYDVTVGEFRTFGDERVVGSMDRFFPERDVVAAAREHGVDVQFSDAFTEEAYRGELARRGPGVQPDGVTVDLFPYQRRAVAQILERDGLGVFLAPGLGKTLVAIAAGHELLQRGVVDRVLVSPPAAVAAQWVDEIRRFVAATEGEVVRIHGDPKQRTQAFSKAPDARWVVVHHDLLARESDAIRPLARGAFLVLDEAHKGAGEGTKRGKEMAYLARTAARRITLTGTPVLNTVSEWFAVMGKLTVPGLFGSGREFCNRYQFPNPYGHGYEGFRRLEELARRSQAHFIRHTKDEVATHLPPLQVRHMPVEVDEKYRHWLSQAHFQAASELTDHFDHVEDAESVGQMTAYGMLRALCSSPRLLHLSDSDAAQAFIEAVGIPDVDGPKVDKVREIARAMQERGERIVMFSYSRSLVKLIAERFDADGIRYVTYHGETGDREREAAVRAFQGDDMESGPTVFLATDAAAEGLNLGHHCSTLLNIDLPWTAGRLDQRFNRIHRVDGTHKSYLAVNMTIRGTVEDSILRKLESKASISDVLFGERSADEITGQGAGTLTQQAVREAVREWTRNEVHTEST